MTDESVWKILDATTGEWWQSPSRNMWSDRLTAIKAIIPHIGTFDSVKKFNDQSRYILKEFKLVSVEE